jgi:hypothetical protein
MPHSATVTWDVDPSLPVPLDATSGYNVYKGTAPGNEGAAPVNGATLIQDTKYVDNAVTGGEKLSYFVTAVLDGVESLHSVEVLAAVPLQPSDIAVPTNVKVVVV